MSPIQLPGPVSQPTYSVTVKRHRVSMRDGLRLFVAAWHPEGDSPFPDVINYDPYRSSDACTLARGNVFEYLLSYDLRGTVGGVECYCRRWMRSYPRRLV